TINLLPLEELSGRVTHADGTPAAGIHVSTQGHGAGQNTFHRVALTDAEGRYKFKAFSEFAYVVAVTDEKWAAPYRAGIVVRPEKPVTGVDFVLTKATRVHGRVTVGASSQPVPKTTVNAVVDKGQIPAEIRRPEDRFVRTVTMNFLGHTDEDGHYELFLGPGEYRLQGPARTNSIKITVPAEGGSEIVRDFTMPR